MTPVPEPSPPAPTADPGAVADAAAAAARGCAGVVDLSGGLVGEIGTYLPGRRVPGVRVQDDRITVHVVAQYGLPLPVVGDEVRAAVGGAVATLAPGRPVDVVVDDVALPTDPDSPDTPAALPAAPPRSRTSRSRPSGGPS